MSHGDIMPTPGAEGETPLSTCTGLRTGSRRPGIGGLKVTDMSVDNSDFQSGDAVNADLRGHDGEEDPQRGDIRGKLPVRQLDSAHPCRIL